MIADLPARKYYFYVQRVSNYISKFSFFFRGGSGSPQPLALKVAFEK